MVQHPFDMLPKDLSRLIPYILFIQTGYSAYVSVHGYIGITEFRSTGLADDLRLVLLGLVLWGTYYLLWELCLRLVPKAGRHTVLALVLVFCLVVPAVGVNSTYYNAVSFAGSAPQALHMRRQISGFDAALQELLAAIFRLDAILPFVDGKSAYYEAELERELATGHYTGVPGPGAVSSTLGAIRDDLTAIGVSVRRITAQAPAISESVTQHVANMRDIIDQDLPIRERERVVADQANRARTLMVRLDLHGTISAIEQALKALEKAADDQAVSSRSSELAEAQRKALAQLAAAMRVTAARLSGFLKDIRDDDNDDRAVLPVITRMTPTKAIIVYADDFAPVWAAAIGIDFSVLAVIFFLMLAQVRKTHLEQAPVDLNRVSAAELIRSHEVVAALVEGGVALIPPKRGPGRPAGSGTRKT